jgi:bacterial leucyl aminopeptidase
LFVQNKDNGAEKTYLSPGTRNVVGLMNDFIDPSLQTFAKQLIDEYLSIGWDDSTGCGYACSDHASWNRYGYPTVLPFETVFGDDNPVIHSTGDTTTANGFSWTHSFEYAKLAVAFAVELSSQ